MTSPSSKTSVMRVYQEVIDDVIHGVREMFLDEGVDESVLEELKRMWEEKLLASKTIEVQQTADVSNQEVSLLGEVSEDLEAGPLSPVEIKLPAHASPPPAPTDKREELLQPPPAPTDQQEELWQPPPAPTVKQEELFQPPQPPAQQPQPQPAKPRVSLVPISTLLEPPSVRANKLIPVEITIPPRPGLNPYPSVVVIQVPVRALPDELEMIITKPVIDSIMHLPLNDAAHVLQQHVNMMLPYTCNVNPLLELSRRMLRAEYRSRVARNASTSTSTRTGNNAPSTSRAVQTDGPLDTSDEDEESPEDVNGYARNGDAHDSDDHFEEPEPEVEDEPLNSADDVTDEDSNDMFDTENIVACQYEKITRIRNKWKFHLKDGIMNLNGEDYVFQKATGDGKW